MLTFSPTTFYFAQTHDESIQKIKIEAINF